MCRTRRTGLAWRKRGEGDETRAGARLRLLIGGGFAEEQGLNFGAAQGTEIRRDGDLAAQEAKALGRRGGGRGDGGDLHQGFAVAGDDEALAFRRSRDEACEVGFRLADADGVLGFYDFD